MPLFFNMEIQLRQYRPTDLHDILKLFRETVHTVNAKDYTKEQLNAWAPETLNAEKWQATLSRNHTLVALVNNEIAGFADIDATGYFDHLFVHKNHQGRGVAKTLVNAIEAKAVAQGFTVITVAASITAKPFFESRGYTVLKEQSVERLGQVLTNYLMEKRF